MERMTWTSNEGVTYERVAGSIRKRYDTGLMWVPIDEPDYPQHAPVGNWSVSAVSTSAITIAFPPKLAVVSASFGPDEGYAYDDGMRVGGSVGIATAVFKARTDAGPFNPKTTPVSTSKNIWFQLDYVIARAELAAA